MKVTVSNDSGELYSYSTDKDLKGVYPSAHEKPSVLAVLDEAARFLNENNPGPPLTPAPEAPT